MADVLLYIPFSHLSIPVPTSLIEQYPDQVSFPFYFFFFATTGKIMQLFHILVLSKLSRSKFRPRNCSVIFQPFW